MLTIAPNLARPDESYAGLIAAHDGLTEAESHAMNARLGLPHGLKGLGVGIDLYEKIIDGAMADRCHKTNPRLATREDYLEMLRTSE